VKELKDNQHHTLRIGTNDLQWNPVKELKGNYRKRLPSQNQEWNPVKELKEFLQAP